MGSFFKERLHILFRILSVFALASVSHAADVFLQASRHTMQVELDVHGRLGLDTPEGPPLHGASLAIVAAHHQENLAWLDTFGRQCKGCHVYVYTSNRSHARDTFQHGTIREVPNVGKEWGKYLRFITDEWFALQQTNATVLFLHAHLKPNSPDDTDRGDVAAVLQRWPAQAAKHILFLHGDRHLVHVGHNNGQTDYGGEILRLWPTLFTELGQMPVALKKDESESLDMFSISGAEFSVPARQIVRKSRGFYQRLDQWLVTQTPTLESTSSYGFEPFDFDYVAGSIFELLAYRIFQGSVPMHQDLYVDNVLKSAT